jgi:beta-lactamase superfamily II metal-dependent hydrolase
LISNSPAENEVEVTLIGTGGGYGECVVLKVAKDSWIVIDSCINPTTGHSLALEYLNKINVDLGHVKLILCTHWHDDHIRGLAKLLEQCQNAEFCFSAVTDLKKFLILCELDYTKSKRGSISSTNEFSNCITIISERGSFCTKAQSNLCILIERIPSFNFELFALSPSPKTVADFDLEVSDLITDFGKRSFSIPNRSPNDKSVALLLKFGDHRVILGADLEIGRNEHEGWLHIMKNCSIIDEVKASLYKISHHGSENGYSNEIFDFLVNKDSVLKLTPWNRKNKLPTIDMLHTYLGHSQEIFMTSPTISNAKPKKRDKTIEKIIKRFSINLSEVKFNQGIVRSRIIYSDKNALWKTEVFDSALKFKA